MSGNVLPIIATILEKTALGTHRVGKMAELIEMVRDGVALGLNRA